MKNETIFRNIFINNTMQLVTDGGFEMATTRAITGDRREINNVKINEAHIYRIFGTKEQLFAEAFEVLDDELIAVIKKGLSLFDTEDNNRKKWEHLFIYIWDFLMSSENKCRYYTRYYYSSYFKGEIQSIHDKKYKKLIDDLTPLFVEKANVRSIFHHVITVILNFAIRIYNSDLADDEDNRTHIFNVAFTSIESYLLNN